MLRFFRRISAWVLMLALAAVLLPIPKAQAKTLEEWLAGYDLGDTWFGDDFAYDINDEAACWELLMRPITVLDAGQTEKIFPRVAPSSKAKKVNYDKLGGSINGASAAVHVLGEDEDGWTLIEGLDYYNRVIRGYVRTKLLKTVTPRDDYGIIIDKLTQTLYVFKEGKLWSSCLVSTGEATGKQPYNETAAGEYLICSRVGDFDSEGMICATALRFNGGDMIHQVPGNQRADGTLNYDRFEPLLGTKASHGCVRTQRVKSPEGLNARWLWDNIKLNTKVVVWDDRGRAAPYPDGNTKVYYNAHGGNSYHSDPCCETVRSEYTPMTEITLADLEQMQFLELQQCTTCLPPRRISEIAKNNLDRGAITLEEYKAALQPMLYPSDDTLIYYNPNGGKNYHSDPRCPGVKERYLPLTAFTYGELETGKYAKLTPCKTCDPVWRKSEIDAYNEANGFTEEELAGLNPLPSANTQTADDDDGTDAGEDSGNSVELVIHSGDG